MNYIVEPRFVDACSIRVWLHSLLRTVFLVPGWNPHQFSLNSPAQSGDPLMRTNGLLFLFQSTTYQRNSTSLRRTHFLFETKKKKALGDSMSDVPNVAAHRIVWIFLGRQFQIILAPNAKLICKVSTVIDWWVTQYMTFWCFHADIVLWMTAFVHTTYVRDV